MRKSRFEWRLLLQSLLVKPYFFSVTKAANSWDKFGTIWENTHLTPLTPTRKHLTLPVEFLTIKVSRFELPHAFLALLITVSLVRVQLGEPVFARVHRFLQFPKKPIPFHSRSTPRNPSNFSSTFPYLILHNFILLFLIDSKILPRYV